MTAPAGKTSAFCFRTPVWLFAATAAVGAGALGWGTLPGLVMAGGLTALVLCLAARAAVRVSALEDLRSEIVTIREKQERNESILHGIPGAVWRSDATASRTFVGETWSGITGHAREQALGEGWLTAVHELDRQRVESLHRLAIGEHQPFEIEYRLSGSGERETWVCDRAAPYFDQRGKFSGFVGLTTLVKDRELSDEVRTQIDEIIAINDTVNDLAIKLADRYDDLEEAKQRTEYDDRLKREFLSALRDELKTPAEELTGLCNLLKRTELDDAQKSYIARLQAADELFRTVLTRTEHLSVIEDDDDGPVDGEFNLRRLIDQMTKRQQKAAEAKGIAISCVVANTVPANVSADSMRLRRMLMDVWAATLKVAQTGRVTLRVSQDPRPGKDTLVQFAYSVSEDGVDQDLIDRAFYPAETIRNEVAGLGLGTTRRFVEEMNGEFGISNDGKGMIVFWLTLNVEELNPNWDGRRNYGRLTQEAVKSNLGEVLDLSLGGMRISCGKPPDGVHEVELTDYVETIKLQAEVAWTKRIGFGKHEAGFKFLKVSEEDSSRLSRLAAQNRLRRVMDQAA